MSGSMMHDTHHGPRRRSSVSSSTPPYRTTTSWTSNGFHYTVDTYSSPGISFRTFSASAGTDYSPFVSTGNSRRPFALLSSAFGLLGDTFAMHPQPQPPPPPPPPHTATRHGPQQVHLSTDTEDDGSDPAHETGYASNRSRRPKSIFSRLKDRLVDTKHYSQRDHSSSRERSPQQPPKIPQKSRRRTHTGQPAWREEQGPDYFIEVDYEDDVTTECTESEPEYTHQSRATAEAPPRSDQLIEALENAVQVEQRNVRACKLRLVQATQQNNVDSSHLQRIVDDLKQHESTLATATQELTAARASQARKTRPVPPNARASYQQLRPVPGRFNSGRSMPDDYPSPPRQRQSRRNMRNESLPPYNDYPFHPHSHHPDPVFQAFTDLHGGIDPFRTSPFGAAFDHIFEQSYPTADDAHFRFFTMPGSTTPLNGQPKRSRASHGPQFHNARARPPSSVPPTSRIPVQPPKPPPATVLRPDEAKRLYQSYNDGWNSLPSTSPDIPYPARGLHAGGLAARDSLYAPLVTAHVGTWSDETVMQANAQAFFLGVVDMTPQYTQSPATGKIEVGFDKAKASAGQMKNLLEILKKEKVRWHSDRLGRRNGGRGGTNEALQKDERARAVFHAVCELMELAQ